MKMKNIFFSIVAVLILFFAYEKWEFWEPSDFTSSSIIYKLKVPEGVQSFPVFSPYDTPLYDFSISDGLKPETIIQRYHSNFSLKEIMKKSEALGFKCNLKESEDYLDCEKIDTQRMLSIYIYSQTSNASEKSAIEVVYQEY